MKRFIKYKILVILFGLILSIFSLSNIPAKAKSEYTTVITAAYPKVTYTIINKNTRPEVIVADNFDSVENLAKSVNKSIAINVPDNLDLEQILTGYNSANKTNTDQNAKYDRSFIGQFQDGSYIIGVMENTTYEELMIFAKTEFKDDIKFLYNLDGGESCGLYIDGQNVYQGRDIKTVIAF